MKIGERGQVTIPKELREKFGLKPETEVEFQVVNNSILLRKKPRKLALARWKGRCRKSFEELGYSSCRRIYRGRAGTMITAIDTNVLLDILAPDPEYFERSVQALEEAAQAGSLVVCDLVYAELCVHFQHQTDCDQFLQQNDIRVEPLTREASFLASRLWRSLQPGEAAREPGF